MLKIICLLVFVFTGCTGDKAPVEWVEWTSGLHKKYKEKFSSPSIVHHIYLDNDGDEAFVKKTHNGFRWSVEKCEDCLVKVQRLTGLGLRLTQLKSGEQITIEKEKEYLVDDLKGLYIKYYSYPETHQIRIFIHDLKQNKLEKKRQRVFFSYDKSEVMVGRFNWIANPDKVTIRRSDGSTKAMSVVAKISYNHKGKSGELSVYDYGTSNDDYKKQSKIMMLYRDYSNGKETYGAGRFLLVDLKKPLGELKSGDSVSVDLNYSYNPPCAVSTGFHCPLPQDTLARKVRVGERYSK